MSDQQMLFDDKCVLILMKYLSQPRQNSLSMMKSTSYWKAVASAVSCWQQVLEGVFGGERAQLLI